MLVDESKTFMFPFEEYSVEDFYNIISNYEFRVVNHGHSTDIYNGEEHIEYSDSRDMLEYIYVIKNCLDLYKKMGSGLKKFYRRIPEVHDFINGIILTIDDVAKKKCDMYKRVWPVDITDKVTMLDDECYFMFLYSVCELYMKNYQMRLVEGSIDETEPSSVEFDMDVLANEVLANHRGKEKKLTRR